MMALGAQAPIIVGGGGGSGTRVIAEALRASGVYIGRDLNTALDNLWFTFLFKHFGILGSAVLGDETRLPDFGDELRLLKQGMFGPAAHSVRDLEILLAKARRMSRHGHTAEGSGKGLWPYHRLAAAMLPAAPRGVGWGFKEPNTHIFLVQLAAAFPGMRYVHVMRHGLDMALSTNQQQLHIWGSNFAVDPPYTDDGPRKSLRYWVRSNARTLAVAERLLEDRFLVVRFDELVEAPREGMAALLKFAGIEPEPDLLERLAKLPRKPKSLGRYRAASADAFDAPDIEAVRGFGFSVAA